MATNNQRSLSLIPLIFFDPASPQSPSTSAAIPLSPALLVPPPTHQFLTSSATAAPGPETKERYRDPSTTASLSTSGSAPTPPNSKPTPPTAPSSPATPTTTHRKRPPGPVSPVGCDPSTRTTTPSGRKPKPIHPSFFPTLRHLSTRLTPLVSATTGLPHPSFPTTLLAFHLLTAAQLDDLATHYHQVWPPVAATAEYPIAIPAWVGQTAQPVDLRTKRRRLGRFIGLRGCESPVEGSGSWGQLDVDMDGDREAAASGGGMQEEEETEEQMLVRIKMEWQEELRAAGEDSDVLLRWKAGGF